MAGTAPSSVPEIRACRSPAASAAVNRYLRESVRVVLEVLGKDVVAAIAVSGSATLGELTAVSPEAGEAIILSDVDLAVVTPDDRRRDRAKSMRSTVLGRLNALGETASILPPAELGVYSLLDLEIQPRKMGVLEMRDSGVVLWGDDEVLRRLPDFRSESIPKREAVLLLCNRCLEHLQAHSLLGPAEPREAIRAIYAAAKSYLDAGTALAAFHGAYVTGYARRLERIESTLAEHYSGGLGALGARDLIEELTFWTGFKIDPDLSEVARRYDRGPDAAGLRDAAREAWAGSARALVEAWTATLAAGGVETSGGVARTCRAILGAGFESEKLGGWRRLVLAGEVPAWRALRLAWSGPPLELLRLSAFCVLDELSRGAPAEQRGGACGDGALGSRSAHAAPGAAVLLGSEERSFLEAYFPASVPGEAGSGGVEAWGRAVVQTWRRWTERFWS